MYDYEDEMPVWWVQGMIETCSSSGQLLNPAPLPINRIREYRRVTTDKVYLDLITDLIWLLKKGLEAGGLVYQIMSDQPFRELRANCHQVVSDEVLRSTAARIWNALGTKDTGNGLVIVQAADF